MQRVETFCDVCEDPIDTEAELYFKFDKVKKPITVGNQLISEYTRLKTAESDKPGEVHICEYCQEAIAAATKDSNTAFK